MSYLYTPSSYIKKRVKEFADKRIDGSKKLYKHRGESNVDKMKNDVRVGTVGEYAVYNLLKDLGYKCTRPDLKIYEKKRKSYDADLFAGGLKIHVKSQSSKSIKRYGRSWLFQRSDKLYKAPEDNEYLAFTSVDEETLEVEVIGFVHACMISNHNLWGECKVPKYRHSKIALYLEDLEPYGIVLDEI